MLEDCTLWLFAFAWFLGGFVNGISGMGAAMVALPIYVSVMHPQTLVPVTCLCVAIVSLSTSWLYWRHTRWHALKAMIIGAVPGALAGLGILLILPSTVLQLAAGAIMVLFALWQFTHSIGDGHGDGFISGSAAGFLSGLVNTSIGFGNPPVAIYSIYAGWSQPETMGSMNVFTLIASVITIVAHCAAGLYTMEVLHYACYGGPATVIGMLAATPLARRVHQAAFKRILLFIIAVAGGVCIWRGVSAILFG